MQSLSSAFAQPKFHIEIGDAYTGWLLDLEARRCTPATLEHYHHCLGGFVDWLQDTQRLTHLHQITPTHIRTYLASLQARKLSGNTALGVYRDIRAWCNFCVVEGWLSMSPTARLRAPKVEKAILPAFTPDDVQRLLGACEIHRDRALVLFLIDTGCRAHEFVELVGADLSLNDGAVTIQKGKGGKGRTVYIGVQTRKALLRYFAEMGKPSPTSPLFASQQTGKALTTSGLRQLLRRLGKRANVAHCHPHTFRRTFALWNLRAGMNIFVLQRLMGHEDLTVLRRYLALVEHDLQAAHTQAGTIDRFLGRGRNKDPPKHKEGGDVCNELGSFTRPHTTNRGGGHG
jgi:site-specific recombinase XerD